MLGMHIFISIVLAYVLVCSTVTGWPLWANWFLAFYSVGLFVRELICSSIN